MKKSRKKKHANFKRMMKNVTRLSKVKPLKEKLVFLSAFVISGMQHCPHEAELEEGSRVRLMPIDNNPHDPFAIKVVAEDQHIGWFPRVSPDGTYDSRTAGPLQQALHRLIKAGVGIRGVITNYRRGAPPTVSLYVVAGK